MPEIDLLRSRSFLQRSAHRHCDRSDILESLFMNSSLTVLKGLYLYVESRIVTRLCLSHRRQTNEILTRWVFTGWPASYVIAIFDTSLCDNRLVYTELSNMYDPDSLFKFKSCRLIPWTISDSKSLMAKCRLIRWDRTWCRNIDCTVIIKCTGIPKQNNFLLDADIRTLRGFTPLQHAEGRM